jgi:hypothetical protein
MGTRVIAFWHALLEWFFSPARQSKAKGGTKKKGLYFLFSFYDLRSWIERPKASVFVLE